MYCKYVLDLYFWLLGFLNFFSSFILRHDNSFFYLISSSLIYVIYKMIMLIIHLELIFKKSFNNIVVNFFSVPLFKQLDK